MQGCNLVATRASDIQKIRKWNEITILDLVNNDRKA